jgi:predicted phage terminase large subunit-like protein
MGERKRSPRRCERCDAAIDANAHWRRKYCSQSCRQLAYAARKAASDDTPDDSRQDAPREALPPAPSSTRASVLAHLSELELDPADPHAVAKLERSLEASLCRLSFADFVKRAWPIVEPTRPMLASVAIDGIVAVLQEAADHGGHWCIDCPPGVGKSYVAAVFWPAWLLLRSEGRDRVMVGSYSWTFAERDSRRCRALVRSEWFQSLADWTIDPEADRVDDWSTTATGRRLITSPSGKATGERVFRQLIDDALNADDAWSEVIRKRTVRWLRETLPSRLDRPAEATRVIIGQRLHPQDPIGAMLELGWRELRLPAIATEDPCELRRDDGSLIWRDPRQPGEPLFADHTPEVLAALKVELGSAAFAAQYQQAPVDESAAMFRRSWFERYEPSERPDTFERIVISLDASFKESASADYAAAQAWGAIEGRRYLLEQWRAQAGFVATLKASGDMARRYPFAKVIIEEAANGHAVVDSLRLQIPGVIGVRPEGGKVARAASVQAIAESGAVYIPTGAAGKRLDWAEAFLDEVCAFPGGKNDDQLDSMVHALRELQRPAAVVSADYIPRHNRRAVYTGPTDNFGRPMELH